MTYAPRSAVKPPYSRYPNPPEKEKEELPVPRIYFQDTKAVVGPSRHLTTLGRFKISSDA